MYSKSESYYKVVLKENLSYEILKRFIDIVCSIVGIILLSPIFIIVAVAIKIENPRGKVIFSQIRCGKDNKTFKMYKFRSMVEDAEKLLNNIQHLNEMDGPVFKIKEDPRITNVGRFIRKTSIDELPQLINILRGDMSIVGPRPPLVREVEKYNQYEMQRLIVKPGLTCYWQISGRNNINFEQWVEMDIKYIEERNLFIDIKLILKTFKVLFGDKHAY